MKHSKGLAFFLSAVLLILATACGAQKTKDSFGPDLTLHVATDLHYLPQELQGEREPFRALLEEGDGKMTHYSEEIITAFTEEQIRTAPDVLILSGDLTNNGEKLGHEQLAIYLERIRAGGTKVFVLPGNHDILNPWARGFTDGSAYETDYIGPEDFRQIYQDLGFSESVSQDPNSLSYFSKLSDDLYLLMLDSSIYEFNELFNSPFANGELSAKTLDWVKECAGTAKKNQSRILAVSHHNLLQHSQRLSTGYALDNQAEVLELFQELGIELFLSGHIHVQHIESTSEGPALYDIATGALSVYPVQYGVIEFKPGSGYRYHLERIDISSWAKEAGQTDSDLLDFDNYSREFFLSNQARKVPETLADAGFSAADIQTMATTLGEVNTEYFAGTLLKARERIEASAGYKLWIDAPEELSWRQYLTSILGPDLKDHSTLEISWQP